MGQGVNAVNAELESEFQITDRRERYDVDREATSISFKAEGRLFVVVVSKEFDDDYSSRTRPADLSRLAPILRNSKNGRAAVRNSGVSPD